MSTSLVIVMSRLMHDESSLFSTVGVLQRVADTENGIAIWTSLSDPKEIKQAVEARSKERCEEQRRSEELMRSKLSQVSMHWDISSQCNGCNLMLS